MSRPGGSGWLSAIGPGLLVAATGVGAGDLATAAFSGSRLGTAVLWAVVAGALLKLVLNEGLARWQLATDTTFLEGVAARIGRVALLLFLPYFIAWSYFVGTALVSACGVATHAMFPVFDDPAHGKWVFGLLHSAAGVALVVAGGYRWFSRIMSVAIAIMFVTVVLTAGLLWPGTAEVARGFVPSADTLQGPGLGWTIALMGGVGGTVTILCYGYWIREEGRRGLGDLRISRIDLLIAYAMTALFGMAMVIIGSTIPTGSDSQGARLIVELADTLAGPLGPAGRWLFLVGAWGAIASSLLGVWQSVPYLFADMVGLLRRRPGGAVDTRGRAYRGYLFALAIAPALGLSRGFAEVQKIYAIAGAAFIPILALALLVMAGRTSWIGRSARNGPIAVALLLAALAFFTWTALR